MGIVREPLAVVFGLVAFAAAFGACWQAGLAWPAASGRAMARVTGAVALVLGAFGFSLGYWEVLSGIGDVFYGFDSDIIDALLAIGAIGLPVSLLGLVLGLITMLHAADVPARAIVPAILAGYAIGWLLDPYATLDGTRMQPVRARYAAATQVQAPADGEGGGGGHYSLWRNLVSGDSPSHKSSGHSSGGGGGGDGGDGGAIILLAALAILAVAGGAITAALVFHAARNKAKEELASHRRRAHGQPTRNVVGQRPPGSRPAQSP